MLEIPDFQIFFLCTHTGAVPQREEFAFKANMGWSKGRARRLQRSI